MEYEVPVEETRRLYVPDFTIRDAPKQLELPPWVEVKPRELLYALRDHVGCPELFEGVHTADIDAQRMHDEQCSEIWKPKLLAEMTGRNVLVVTAVNRTRILSILMLPDHIELSKSHPGVNHREVTRKREQALREAQWRAEYEQRQAELEEQQQRWRQQMIEYARAHGRRANFDAWCLVCRQPQPAADLVIFRDADGRWVAVCRGHLAVST